MSQILKPPEYSEQPYLSDLADLPLLADGQPKILPPTDDRIFKTLMTHPDAKPVLISVASTIVERTVIDVNVRNTEMPISDINEKGEHLLHAQRFPRPPQFCQPHNAARGRRGTD